LRHAEAVVRQGGVGAAVAAAAADAALRVAERNANVEDGDADAPRRPSMEALRGARARLRAGRVVGPRGGRNERVLEAQQAGRNFATRAASDETAWSNPKEMSPADQGALIQITGRFMDGKEDIFHIHENNMVSAFKSLVAAKLEISSARVKLIHGMGVLQSNQLLADGKVKDGDTVTVIVLPPIYEGSQVYDQVARQIKYRSNNDRTNTNMSEEEVNEHMADMMDRKSALHEALAQKNLLKKRF